MLDGYDRIVVTGGRGFVGQHLVRSLVTHGRDVTVVDNGATATAPKATLGAAVVHADIRIPTEVGSALSGADLVFHLAGNPNGTLSVFDPRFDFETNAVGTFNVAEAARASGVRRLVFLSSAAVYGRPLRCPIDETHPTAPFLPYGASKLAAEAACLALYQSCGLPVVIARSFCVYGPGDNPMVSLGEVNRYLRWHLNYAPIQLVGDSRLKTRDFLHVADLVDALIILAERAEDGAVLNIGSGEEISLARLVDEIGRITARTPTVSSIIDETDDTFRFVADIGRLSCLGYRPKVTLASGLQALADQLGEYPDLPGGQTILALGQVAERL